MELLSHSDRDRVRALLPAAVTTVFIGTGKFLRILLLSIVNGRTDCSYEKPVITPSDAWLSNCREVPVGVDLRRLEVRVVVVVPLAGQGPITQS